MRYRYPVNAPLTYQEAYREAQKTVNAKVEFIFSLISYVIVNTLLFVIWLTTQSVSVVDLADGFRFHGTQYPWFLWVLIPWGVGLVFQFLRAFMYTGRNRQQMIDAELRKMGLSSQPTPYYPTQPTESQEQK